MNFTFKKQQTLDNKYEHLSKIENFQFVLVKLEPHILGTGSYGEVILSKNIKDNKYYAIKRLEKEKILSQGGNFSQIYSEVQIHKNLKHRNIIKLYSFIEDEKYFYLVLEYAKGGSLYQIIQINSKLDEEKSFKYFYQILNVIDYIHSKNLVHRDLKPENILLDGDCIKLCDFGWCVELNNNRRQTFCGTFEYMAPEIIRELPYNQSVDLWSCGVLLYETVHGFSPYSIENKFDNLNQRKSVTHIDIFKNILKNNLVINQNLSLELIDLIRKLLVTENEKRITIKQVLIHPWVLKFEEEIKNLKKQIIEEELKEVEVDKKSCKSLLDQSRDFLSTLKQSNKNVVNINKKEELKKQLKQKSVCLSDYSNDSSFSDNSSSIIHSEGEIDSKTNTKSQRITKTLLKLLNEKEEKDDSKKISTNKFKVSRMTKNFLKINNFAKTTIETETKNQYQLQVNKIELEISKTNIKSNNKIDDDDPDEEFVPRNSTFKKPLIKSDIQSKFCTKETVKKCSKSRKSSNDQNKLKVKNIVKSVEDTYQSIFNGFDIQNYNKTNSLSPDQNYLSTHSTNNFNNKKEDSKRKESSINLSNKFNKSNKVNVNKFDIYEDSSNSNKKEKLIKNSNNSKNNDQCKISINSSNSLIILNSDSVKPKKENNQMITLQSPSISYINTPSISKGSSNKLNDIKYMEKEASILGRLKAKIDYSNKITEDETEEDFYAYEDMYTIECKKGDKRKKEVKKDFWSDLFGVFKCN